MMIFLRDNFAVIKSAKKNSGELLGFSLNLACDYHHGVVWRQNLLVDNWRRQAVDGR